MDRPGVAKDYQIYITGASGKPPGFVMRPPVVKGRLFMPTPSHESQADQTQHSRRRLRRDGQHGESDATAPASPRIGELARNFGRVDDHDIGAGQGFGVERMKGKAPSAKVDFPRGRADAPQIKRWLAARNPKAAAAGGLCERRAKGNVVAVEGVGALGSVASKPSRRMSLRPKLINVNVDEVGPQSQIVVAVFDNRGIGDRDKTIEQVNISDPRIEKRSTRTDYKPRELIAQQLSHRSIRL